MYQEIIRDNQQIILDLYYSQNLKKSHIAHKLIHDLDLDFTNAQVDSFRRTLSQYLMDWEDDRRQKEGLSPVPTESKYPNAIHTRAKVLLLDIETTPIWGAFWGVHKQHLTIDNVVIDSHLLCWAGKWLFEPEVFGDCLTSEEAKAHDDKRICQSVWDVMDEADIIIAHNGRKFDVPKLNGRFMVNGFSSPPSPFEIIDTYESAKKSINITSLKLDFINRVLGITRKLDTKFQLWLDCSNGSQKALLEMFTYCKNDTAMLEETYMELRKWIKAHPNMGFYVESDNLTCPTCGCNEVVEVGIYRTPVNEYAAYRCPQCGSIGRSRLSVTTVAKKRTLLVSPGR